MRISLNIPGDPVVQPRGKPVRRGGFVALVSAHKSHPVWMWRDRIIHEAAKAGAGVRFEGPVKISVLFVTSFTGTPRKTQGNPRRWHTARGDIENFLKPLLDALTEAGVWLDDGQVSTYGSVSKVRAAHGEQPHTRVLIEEAPPVETVEAVWREPIKLAGHDRTGEWGYAKEEG